MTPATLADRKALLAWDVDATRGRLSELLIGFQPGSAEHSAIRDANVQLSALLHRCNTLADGLQPYTDPAFYAELVPSLAKDDQGQHARNKLDQAFPE